MRETRTLEFMETITNTFLKTVSAFSNYDGGTVLFGVDDDGNIKGLRDVKQATKSMIVLHRSRIIRLRYRIMTRQ